MVESLRRCPTSVVVKCRTLPDIWIFDQRQGPSVVRSQLL